VDKNRFERVAAELASHAALSHLSGFINLLRNVGGSVGISLVETMVARRTQFHQDEIIAHVTPAQQPFRTLTDGLSAQLFHRGLSQPQAVRQTLLRIYDATITQATGTVVHGRRVADRRNLSVDGSGRTDAWKERPEGGTRERRMIANSRGRSFVKKRLTAPARFLTDYSTK
jgi:hypothetical protein